MPSAPSEVNLEISFCLLALNFSEDLLQSEKHLSLFLLIIWCSLKLRFCCLLVRLLFTKVACCFTETRLMDYLEDRILTIILGKYLGCLYLETFPVCHYSCGCQKIMKNIPLCILISLTTSF